MSETVLKILLEELSTIRVRCANAQCRGSLELDVTNLKQMNWNLICPGCGAELRRASVMRGGKEDALDQLADALAAIKVMPGVRFEFVLPVKE